MSVSYRSTATPDWYRLPDAPEDERYWNGSEFTGPVRRASSGRRTLPMTDEAGHAIPAAPRRATPAQTATAPPPRPSPSKSEGWSTAAGVVGFICALTVLGAFIGGIALMVQTVPVCTVAFDDSIDCSSTNHPFVLTGVVLVVAGLLQAFVVGVVAKMASEFSRGRAQ